MEGGGVTANFGREGGGGMASLNGGGAKACQVPNFSILVKKNDPVKNSLT
jgi:hypothetical protein